jgi:mannose-6-phosphate isomerase-like protein (cupin superfamily)
LELRDQTVVLSPGDLYVVPRGVEHRPAARHGQVHLMVMEKKGTPNTGDVATAAKKKYL